MGCFTTILFLAGFVMIMVTFIRWFDFLSIYVAKKAPIEYAAPGLSPVPPAPT